MTEKLTYKTVWRVLKFDADIENYPLPWWKKVWFRLRGLPVPAYDYDRFFADHSPIETIEFEGNILLNDGINELWKVVTGTGGTAFNASNAYVGVGDGTTAENASQTGLLGTNKLFKGMDTGYPQVSGQTATWQATFGGTEANFAWNEAGVANGNNPPTSGKLLNRKVQSMGTKSAGSTWILQVQITLS